MKVKFFQAILVLPLVLLSCDKGSFPSQEIASPSQSGMKTQQAYHISSFAFWGSVHNNVMDAAYIDLEFDTNSIEILDDALNQVVDFVVPELAIELVSFVDEEEILAECNKIKWIASEDLAFDSLFINDCSWMLSQHIDGMLNDSIIGDFEYSVLNRIISACSLNFDQTISNLALSDSISSWVSEYNDYGFDIEVDQGIVLGVVLGIASASDIWWSEVPPQELPPWVALDIAGAILGGIGGAINSLRETGEVSAGSVGTGAVYGAVVGSVGAIPRLAGYIRSIM